MHITNTIPESPTSAVADTSKTVSVTKRVRYGGKDYIVTSTFRTGNAETIEDALVKYVAAKIAAELNSPDSDFHPCEIPDIEAL
jgi:hypothetical protein